MNPDLPIHTRVSTIMKKHGVRMVAWNDTVTDFDEPLLVFHPHIMDFFNCKSVDDLLADIQTETGAGVVYKPEGNRILVRWQVAE